MKETFWMVFAEGGNTPTYKHTSRKSAETEAQRIAKLSGRKVFVLSTVKSYMVYQFTEEDCTPENEIENLFSAMTPASEHLNNATLGNEKTFLQHEVIQLMESYARLHHIEQLERAKMLADHAYLNEVIHCKKCDDWDGLCEAHRR